MVGGRRILLTPGPVELHPRVLQAMAKPLVSHRSPEFRRLLSRVQEGLSAVLGVGDPRRVLVMAGSGTTAVDAMLWSLVEPGDKVLVASWGEFGERLADSLRALGARVTVARAPPGSAIPPKDLAEQAVDGGFKWLALVHNETSTGVAYRGLETLARRLEGWGVGLLVDAVSSAGAEEIGLDGWGITAVATCSHKAIAAPPGAAIVALSEEAAKTLEKRGSRAPPSIDLSRSLRFSEERSETPYTPPIPVLYALEEALELLGEEGGVPGRRKILAERAAMIYGAGLSPLPQEEELLSITTAALKARNPAALKREAAKEGIEIALGMGELKDKIIRIGLMGHPPQWALKKITYIIHKLN